jgi:glycosyltransferase involved in cell wall biosynthesis
VRIAWFSPFPPVRTGIAACSADLVAALAARGHLIDPYPSGAAHDFPWRHRQQPYDLVVYQFGNSSHHDYEWAYAFRYPGLIVLHDTHLHHARAAFLLPERRAADYRAEFRFNHPDVPADAAELAVAGFDNRLYYEWPMVRALVESARLVAVHGEGARAELLTHLPPRHDDQIDEQIDDAIVAIRLGHGELVSAERAAAARSRIRALYGIPPDAVLFGAFGGLTPDKRIPQVLAALRAILPHVPAARLLLAGGIAAHYDLHADIARHGLAPVVTVAGYVETDAALTDHLAACDVSLNLRWPTARETSGPWLRALAAGVATVITDLAHLGGVPSLDPQTWRPNIEADSGMCEGRGASRDARGGTREAGREMREAGDPIPRLPPPTPLLAPPATVAIDILDEDHSLRLAMRALGSDAELRGRVARGGREYWQRAHSLDGMVDDYERILTRAAARPDPRVELPAHLRNAGEQRLRSLLAPLGVETPW